MLIGGGLLASALSDFRYNKNVLIMASGVSDSDCNDQKEFQREKELLNNSLASIPDDTVFVYFGTCSVYDEERLNTPYVRHKLEMEKLVCGQARKYIICRLPNAAGRGGNPHTLLNFMFSAVESGRELKIWEKATRNIVDVVNIRLCLEYMLDRAEFYNKIHNLANPESVFVTELVSLIEQVVGKKAKCIIVKKGQPFQIEISEQVGEMYEKLRLFEDKNYLFNVLKKYYGKENGEN